MIGEIPISDAYHYMDAHDTETRGQKQNREHLSGALLWSIYCSHNVSRYNAEASRANRRPPKPLPTPSLPPTRHRYHRQRRRPPPRRTTRCHHLTNYRLYRHCHRTNVAASPSAVSEEEITSVVRAQRRTHWEGAKFYVVVTARTRTAAVAAAAAMRWGGRTSRRGQWTLVRTTFGPADWREGRRRGRRERRGRRGRRTRMTTTFDRTSAPRGKEWLGLRPRRLRWAEPQPRHLK